jgi:hypothetical protein
MWRQRVVADVEYRPPEGRGNVGKFLNREGTSSPNLSRYGFKINKELVARFIVFCDFCLSNGS